MNATFTKKSAVSSLKMFSPKYVISGLSVENNCRLYNTPQKMEF